MLERKMWIAFLIDLSVNSNILFSYKFNWVSVKKKLPKMIGKYRMLMNIH